MNFRTWSVYDAATGLFTGQRLSGNFTDDGIAVNIPAGCAAAEGRFDPAKHRVDTQSGEIIELSQSRNGPA